MFVNGSNQPTVSNNYTRYQPADKHIPLVKPATLQQHSTNQRFGKPAHWPVNCETQLKVSINELTNKEIDQHADLHNGDLTPRIYQPMIDYGYLTPPQENQI